MYNKNVNVFHCCRRIFLISIKLIQAWTAVFVRFYKFPLLVRLSFFCDFMGNLTFYTAKCYTAHNEF